MDYQKPEVTVISLQTEEISNTNVQSGEIGGGF